MARRRPRRHADRCRRAAVRRETARRTRSRRSRRCAADRRGAELMGPTRKRDLTAATVVVAVAAYLLVLTLYRFFPPITPLSGVSLLVVALAEVGWAFYVRSKINDGHIGDGPGWLHPL